LGSQRCDVIVQPITTPRARRNGQSALNADRDSENDRLASMVDLAGERFK